jgi:hypothetical protein
MVAAEVLEVLVVDFYVMVECRCRQFSSERWRVCSALMSCCDRKMFVVGRGNRCAVSRGAVSAVAFAADALLRGWREINAYREKGSVACNPPQWPII